MEGVVYPRKYMEKRPIGNKIEPTLSAVKRDFSTILNHPDHMVRYGDLDIFVMDGVFTPDPEISLTSSFLAHEMGDVQDKRVLDVGCGTGALALHAAEKGAKHVVAVDVDDKAVRNTEVNIERLQRGARVEVRKSNLFEHVPEQFDVIVANLPISDEFWDDSGLTLTTAQRFVREYSEHLTLGGRAYLAWGSFGNVEGLRAFLAEKGVKYQEKSVERGEYTYMVFILGKNES